MSSQVLSVVVQGKNEATAAFDQVTKLTQEMRAEMRLYSDAAAIGKRMSEQLGDALRDQAAVEKAVADEARRLTAEMNEGTAAVKAIGAGAKESHSHFDELGHAFASGLGMGAFLTLAGGVEKILHSLKEVTIEAIKGTADYAEKHELAALKLGMTTDATQRLSVMANISRSSLEQLSSAVVMMERNVNDGMPKAVASMEKLGLTADIFKDPEQAVLSISKALQTIPEPAERASIAMGLLGRGGGNALPVLLQDLEAIGARAERLGIVMGEDDVRAAAALNQESEILHETWEGLIRNFGLVFDSSGEVGSGLKNVTDTVGDLSQAVKEARPFLQDYYGLLARLAGLTQLGQSLEVLRQFRNNLKEIYDQQDPLRATARLLAPDDSNYFKESLAQQRAYLTAVMENQRIEEREAKRHQSELKKTEDERIRELQASQRQLQKDGDAFEKSWLEQQKREIASQKAYVAQITFDEKQRAEMMKVQSDLMTEIIVNGFKDQASARKDDLKDLKAYAGELVSAFRELGSAIGGVFGGILDDIGASIGRAMDNYRNQTAAGVAAIQAAIAAAAGGYATGQRVGSPGRGALAGAGSGALAGAPYGGVGIAVGATLGAIGGFIGGKKAQKEQQQAMEEMRHQMLLSFGGLEALRKKAGELGVDISRAFSTKDPQEFQGIVDEINTAMADQQRHMQGLQTAVQGLNLMTQGFTATLQLHGEATEADAAAFQRLGDYAAATFGAMVSETGDVIGALQAMEPTLAQLATDAEQFGLSGSAALQELLGLRQVVVDNADLAQSIQGLNLLMKGLGDAGIANSAIFQAFGKDAAATFAELTGRGVDANQAMILMQPSLQQLWEHQQKFHDITDEATLALLDQAQTAGLVGEDQKSVYDRILGVLEQIRDLFLGLDGKTVNTHLNVNEHYHPDPNHPGRGGGGDGDDGEDRPGRRGAASGFYSPALPYDVDFTAHRGERVEITPASQTPARNAQAGGGVVNFNITVAPVINGATNPAAVTEAVAAAFRKGVLTEVARQAILGRQWA